MVCGVNVFIVRLEHAILYPECINTKKKHNEWYEMGVKSFVLCCNENEPETPLMFCTRFKQSERVLSSVSLPLRHFQATGARKRSDKMERRHLEL